MKKRFSLKVWFQDTWEQLLQFIALIGALLLPFRFDFKAVVELQKPKMEIQELAVYYALRHGNICVSIILAVLMIMMFHKINEKKVLNKGNRYHRRTMFGYWFCSHVLGYRKCSLIRVPISDQFKLILSDTFDEYELGDYEKASADEIVSLRRYGRPAQSSLLQQNIVANDADIRIESDNIFIAISDTYPIKDEMLPNQCNESNTVIIQRLINKEDNKRYESNVLTAKVLNVIKHINKEVIVNVLPTTNACNTYNIVNEVFKTGGQDNIKHLFVYPQPHKTENDWSFSEKGKRIF